MTGELTESVFHKVVEGVAVTVVGELVVARGELHEALGGDGGEVAGELRVLGQYDRATGHERVDQRLLPHGRLFLCLPPLPPLVQFSSPPVIWASPLAKP